MKCQWQAYMNLLPHWMRQEVDKQGRECLQELRIRIGHPPELVLKKESVYLDKPATKEDIAFIVNVASEYSPWTAGTVAQGFLTAPGGHRIGICGVCAVSQGKICSVSQPTSLCLRVARDFNGIAEGASRISGSVLIIGPPGSGKTTLLRDLIRCKSNLGQGSVSVVDEREELFPLYRGQACFSTGLHTDIVCGCPKDVGIESVLRSMNPNWIAVDEITGQNDCQALLHAGWCGVNLLATAHAGSIQDLKTRPIYRPLVSNKLFPNIILLQKDKSWTIERLSL